MEIKFNREDLAAIFGGAAHDIRFNYENDYGKGLLSTEQQNAVNLLESIENALMLSPLEED